MESWLSRALERQDGDIARISDLRKRATPPQLRPKK